MNSHLTSPPPSLPSLFSHFRMMSQEQAKADGINALSSRKKKTTTEEEVLARVGVDPFRGVEKDIQQVSTSS